MLPVYRLSIDPELEEGKELGIFEIANTATPAIKIKGVAFAEEAIKNIYFADDKKFRIAAPVLTPSKIYRKDPETEEAYYVEVDTEFIEHAYTDFMSKRMGKQVFNEEHDEGKKPPSFILETWLVEDPKTDKSKTIYGIDVPKGSWFAVQQFTDKEVYADYVKRGLTGFSIHGHSAMLLMSQNTNKMSKETKMSDKPSAYVELPVGVHTIGDTTYTVEEVIENAGTENEWKSNQIVKMVPASESTEMEEEKKEETEMNEIEKKDTELEDEKKKDTEMSDEEKKKDAEMTGEEKKAAELEEQKKDETELEDEEKKDTEMEETTSDNYSREELDKKFEEIFDMIADLKSTTQEEKAEEEEANVQMSEHDRSVKEKVRRLEMFAKGVKNK